MVTMLGRRTSLLACLCGSPVQEHQERTEWPTTKSKPPSTPAVSDNYPNDLQTNELVETQRQEATESLSLLSLQRELVGLQGTWLVRARATLLALSSFLGGAEVRFYGASRSAKDGPPESFVLLISAGPTLTNGNYASAGTYPVGGYPESMPGQQIWPASVHDAREADGDFIHLPVNRTATMQSVLLDSHSALLDRMLAEQAAVLHNGAAMAAPLISPSASSVSTYTHAAALMPVPSASTGLNSRVVALVPLSTGNHILGALWIRRYPQLVPASSAVSSNAIPPAAGTTTRLLKRMQSDSQGASSGSMAVAFGPTVPSHCTSSTRNKGGSGGSGGGSGKGASGSGRRGGKTRTTSTAVPCPSVLTNPRALQQLGLSVSMCLLGAETDLPLTLSEGLHQLAAAYSMQQLVGALCEMTSRYVRQRFLLEPRVTAALIPEASSAVGLLFSWAADHTAAAAAVAAAAAAVPTRLRTVRTAAASVAEPKSAEARRTDTATGAAAEGGLPASGRVAGRVATLMMEGPPGLAKSDSAARCIERAALYNASPDREGAVGGGGAVTPRSVRTPSWQRVVALAAHSDGDSPACAAGVKSGAGGGSAATVDPVALRVKPFPLAQTLLRQLMRRAAAAAGSADNVVEGIAAAGATASASVYGRTAVTVPHGQRVSCLEVDDVTAHLQDPKKPSRDILMLLANTGIGLNTQPNLAHSGSFPAVAQPLFGSGNWDRYGGSTGSTGPAGGSTGFGPGGFSMASGSFTSGRRAVSSMVLLALPAGEGKGTLGLYVSFPQQLPRQLLREASSNLQEILEVASPLVSRKLFGELSVEMETLATAAPGSYAVLEGPEGDDCSMGPGNPLNCRRDGTAYPLDPIKDASATVVCDNPTDDTAGINTHLLPIFGCPAVPSFLYDSRVGPGSVGGGGGGDACVAAPSLNLMDTTTSPPVAGDVTLTAGVTSLLSGRYNALTSQQPMMMSTAPGADGLSRSTNVIHMEELDPVNSTLRAQMPMLVASLQKSITHARMEAAVAAAASFHRLAPPSLSVPRNTPAALPPGLEDLAQLELQTQLGHGGCAVVFKGTLGTLDCAVKLMEMPDVEEVVEDNGAEDLHPVTPPPGAKRPSPSPATTAGTKIVTCAAGTAGARGGTEAAVGDGGAAGGDDDKHDNHLNDECGNKELAARRALLRNAMELAAMTSISHPNIMQVFNTFSNVTLGRRTRPDGSERFYLRPLGHDEDLLSDAPPICVAIVCEWCDQGCLASALHKRTFPLVLPVPVGAGTSSRKAGAPSRPSRMLDYKGICMTLLDVAMALRHMHSHNLIHRDLKPANVLLRSNPTDPRGFTAKLADFGFVTLLNQPGDEKSGGEPFAFMEETCGTVTHMPPESWSKSARLDASCDVFSFGILMWEMTAGGIRPYPEVHPNNIPRVVRRGVRPVFDEAVPMSYRLLAQRCWSASPLHRPRSTELVGAVSQLLGKM